MTMTAVAVQQQQHGGAHRQQYNQRQSSQSSTLSSANHSRPQSYTASPGPSQLQRQEPPIQNGTSGPMNPRPAVSNDPVQVVNGHRSSDTEYRRSSNTSGRATPAPVDNGSDRRRPLQPRPTSAPDNRDSSPDDSEVDKTRKRPKPLLMRSKSDFGPRKEDVDAQAEETWQHWGARHGFEDHYASEEYVSQLANVGCAFLYLRTLSFPGVSAYQRTPGLPMFRNPSSPYQAASRKATSIVCVTRWHSICQTSWRSTTFPGTPQRGDVNPQSQSNIWTPKLSKFTGAISTSSVDRLLGLLAINRSPYGHLLILNNWLITTPNRIGICTSQINVMKPPATRNLWATNFKTGG